MSVEESLASELGKLYQSLCSVQFQIDQAEEQLTKLKEQKLTLKLGIAAREGATSGIAAKTQEEQEKPKEDK